MGSRFGGFPHDETSGSVTAQQEEPGTLRPVKPRLGDASFLGARPSPSTRSHISSPPSESSDGLSDVSRIAPEIVVWTGDMDIDESEQSDSPLSSEDE
jgi:hypothetical protein